MTQPQTNNAKTGKPPPNYMDLPKADFTAMIDVPLIAHDIMVTTSSHAHEVKGSKRKCEVIVSHPDAPNDLKKLIFWREYIIIQFDRLAGRFLPYNTIEQKYNCEAMIPFRITLNGRFVRIIQEGEDEEEGSGDATKEGNNQ